MAERLITPIYNNTEAVRFETKKGEVIVDIDSELNWQVHLDNEAVSDAKSLVKNGITVLNTPGTIDSDYRGEVCVILINHSQVDFTITRGMRIAQVVIAACVQARVSEVENLDETVRGAGGFGSTGH